MKIIHSNSNYGTTGNNLSRISPQGSIPSEAINKS